MRSPSQKGIYMTMRPNEKYALLRFVQIAEAFEAWIRENGNQLAAAADFLGGSNWKTRAENIIAAIEEGRPIVGILDELRALYSLFIRESVQKHSPEGAMCSAMWHRKDVLEDEIRICAEALGNGVEVLEKLARYNLDAAGG